MRGIKREKAIVTKSFANNAFELHAKNFTQNLGKER